MPVYEGTPAHIALLRSALRELISNGHTADGIARDINDVKRGSVSRQHIGNLIGEDPAGARPRRWSFPHNQVIFNFLMTSVKYRNSYVNSSGLDISKANDPRFFSAMYNYTNTEHALSLKSLLGFVGKYAMFRPLWASQEKKWFIRSIVDIEREGDVLNFSEKQDYSYNEEEVKEEDFGHVFCFYDSIFAVTKESESKGLKFISMNVKAALNGRTPVQMFRGALIAVTPGTDSPAQLFVCRRILNNDTLSRIVPASEIDDESKVFFGIKT